MLSLDQTAVQQEGRVSLPRRISEIMQEKGDAYSIRAFSQRIGISRETLRLILLGERPIPPSTIEKIASGLGLSIERLRQFDSLEKEQSLSTILEGKKRTKTMLLHARTLADELVKIALGASERGYALINLGRVLFLQGQYEDAHKSWLDALDFAKQVQEQYKDNFLLNLVSVNLMLTYTTRKEYTHIEKLLAIVEKELAEDSDKLGKAYYTRMMVENSRGNYELSKKYAYRSLEHFEQTFNERHIGKALVNVAYCEYLLGNFKTSARALSSAIEMIKEHEDILVIAVKDYAKTLIKLKKYDRAARVIEQYELVARENQDVWGKIQIMNTVIKDDYTYANRISNDPQMSLKVRYLACKCLFEYFIQKDDAEAAISYYKKGRIYSNAKTEFYDQEGF